MHPVSVEGNEDLSDDELDTPQDDESPEASSILSPASKRAKKRQAAARNKRAKQEAKQQQAPESQPSKSIPGLTVKPSASNLKSASSQSAVNGQQQQQQTTKANGASQSLPAPPTFVSDSAAMNGRLASETAASASSSNGPKLGDPFLQSSSSGAAADYAASAATETEEEDTSLLLDEDDESSSSSEAEDDEGDISMQSREDASRAEPPTPRPAVSKPVMKAVTDATASLKSGTNSALNAVAQSSAVPNNVQKLAASARDSEVLKPVEAGDATAQPYGSDHDPSKKWKSVVTRTVWTLVMVIGFSGKSLWFALPMPRGPGHHLSDAVPSSFYSSHDYGSCIPHYASHVLPSGSVQRDFSTIRRSRQAHTYTSS